MGVVLIGGLVRRAYLLKRQPLVRLVEVPISCALTMSGDPMRRPGGFPQVVLVMLQTTESGMSKNPVVNTGINYYLSLNWFSRQISEASTMLIHINNNPQPAILLLKKCCTKLFVWHLEIWNSKLFASFLFFFPFWKRYASGRSSHSHPRFLPVSWYIFFPLHGATWKRRQLSAGITRFKVVSDTMQGSPEKFFGAVGRRFHWM